MAGLCEERVRVSEIRTQMKQLCFIASLTYRAEPNVTTNALRRNKELIRTTLGLKYSKIEVFHELRPYFPLSD